MYVTTIQHFILNEIKKRKKEKGKTNTQNKSILPGTVTKTVRKSSCLKEISSTE